MASKKRESGEGGNSQATKKQKQQKSFSIDEALGDVDSTLDELSAGRPKNEGKAGSQVVESLVQQLQQLSAKVPLNSLEVELRVGLLSSSTGFRPGVHQEDYDLLLQLLSSSKPHTVTDEVDYIYPDRLRVSWDASESRPLRAVKKANISNPIDVGSNLAYDFRVSIASETEVSTANMQAVEPGFQTRRHKKRVSFKDKYWRIDLTTVTTNQLGTEAVTVSYEVEFELHPSSIPNHADKANMMNIITQFIAEPRKIVSALEEPTDRSFPEVIMEKVGDPEELATLRDACMKCFPEEENKGQAFPGSMPINFSRKHFSFVQNRDYFVSEKTDGLRYMLLVTKEAPFFVDRKFDFYMIQGFDLLIDLYGSNGVTLLDGELIRNLSTQKAVYMIFDGVQLNGGESVAHLPLSQRFTLIGQAVGDFRKGVTAQKINELSLPFSIIGKRFMPKTSINELYQHIKTTAEGSVFKDDKRHHPTDGLIFTPNTRYQTFTSYEILKWKFIEKLTIDFKYRSRGHKRVLSCGGVNDTEVDCREAKFSESDTKKLYRDVGRARDQNSIIVECSFETGTGIWKYHGLRHDKHKPNFIATVFDTMENIAENITAEEVRYRISVQQKYDDWEHRMRGARDQLLAKLMNHAPSSSRPPTRNPHQPPQSNTPSASQQQQHISSSSSSSSSRPITNPHHQPQHPNPHRPSHPSQSHSSMSHPSQSQLNPHHSTAPNPHRPSSVPSTSASNINNIINHNNVKPGANAPSSYDFGDDNDDEYDDGDQFESAPPRNIPNAYNPNSNNNSNGHGYRPPPTTKTSSSSYDEDEFTTGGEDWQKPEEIYEYDDNNGQEDGDDE